MKTNSFKFICMLMALTTFGIYNAQSQTYGYGGLVGIGACTTTGTAGGCTNSYFGQGAGSAAGLAPGNTAPKNTFLGCQAGYANQVFGENVGVGYQALYTQVGGAAQYLTYNVAVGNGALFSNNPNNTGTNGIYNTAIGHNALYYNSTGISNTASGYQSSYNNLTGNNNTSVGYQALFTAAGAGDADNTAIGYQALFNTNGTNKGGLTAIGSSSGYSNTTGANNTFSGYQSGYTNSTGQDNTFSGFQSGLLNTASYNTFVGSSSGYSNTTGANNTFSGYQSGNSNTTGAGNTFSGYQSGKVNTTASDNTFSGGSSGVANTTGAYNTISGYQSGYSNTTGADNTFIGIQAGLSNNTTSYNTFVGGGAGYHNTGAQNTFTGYGAGYYSTGSYNSIYGDFAGFHNTLTGNYNTILGYYAGQTLASGDSNTFVGAYANVGAGGGAYHNCAAFGYGALALGSDKMYFGNATIIGCYNAPNYWGSDGRFKFNVQENVKGLEFINKLRAITYQMNTQQLDAFIKQNMPQQTDSSGNPVTTPVGNYSKSMSIVHSGFIAQEVEQAENESGFTSSIVSKPENSNEIYALSYAEIVVPLVKAVQELSKRQDSLNAVIANLTGASSRNSRTNNGTGNSNTAKNIQDIKLSLPDAATLGNAQPNPNNGSTQIPYYLPDNISDAKIIFTDMLGKVMEEKPLQPGYGLLNIDTQSLPNGTYSYNMVIDGRVIDSKQMIRKK